MNGTSGEAGTVPGQGAVETHSFPRPAPHIVSLLVEQEANPEYIQEEAGHSRIQVIMDTYGHLFPSRDQGWTDRLYDAAINAENRTPGTTALDLLRADNLD
jgi:hypothetical protein